MKQKSLYFIAFILMIGLIGCSTDKNNIKETKQLIIEPTSVKEEKIVGNHKIIKIHYKFENKTNKDFGVAANDFIIKANGEYYHMGSGINYSNTLKKQEKSEGNGYYEIPKDVEKFKLMYQPLTNNERAEWDLKVSK